MSLKEIQKISVDIVKDIHSFCQENKIRYTLAYGSLIGAVRHKGFIPWDDDIDILMPRPDYETFIKTYTSSNGYIIIPEGNKSMIAMSRVCETKKTIVIQERVPWCREKVGIWVDIFPLDGAEEDYNLFSYRVNEIYKLWRYNYKYRYCRGTLNIQKGLFYNLKLIVKKIIWGRCKLTTVEHVKKMKEIEYGATKFVTNLASPTYREKEYFPIQLFDEYVEVEFENEKFLIIKAYDVFLRIIYGDYMTLPPIEKRISKHSIHKYYWK